MYPDEKGEYEFERKSSRRSFLASDFGGVKDPALHEETTNNLSEDDGVLDLMDMIIPEDQEEQIKKNLMVKRKIFYLIGSNNCFYFIITKGKNKVQRGCTHLGTKYGYLWVLKKSEDLRS